MQEESLKLDAPFINTIRADLCITYANKSYF